MTKRARLEIEPIFDEESDEYRIVKWGQYFDMLVAEIGPLFEEFMKNPFKIFEKTNKNSTAKTFRKKSIFYFKFKSEWTMPAAAGPQISFVKKHNKVYITMGYKTFDIFNKFANSFAFDLMVDIYKVHNNNDTYTIKSFVQSTSASSWFTSYIVVYSVERFPVK